MLVGVHVTSDSVVDDRKNIEKIRIHPRYNYLTADYDFSILFLTLPLIFSDTIRQICLPASTQSDYKDQVATVIGWGDTGAEGNSASTLQEAEVTVMSNGDCENDYPRMIERYLVCTKCPPLMGEPPLMDFLRPGLSISKRGKK